MNDIKKNNLETILNSNGFTDYEFDSTIEVVHVTVECGDWKHGHMRLKNLMKDNSCYLVGSENIGDDTGDDSYSAIHTFIY